jgi:hypothetical protein
LAGSFGQRLGRRLGHRPPLARIAVGRDRQDRETQDLPSAWAFEGARTVQCCPIFDEFCETARTVSSSASAAAAPSRPQERDLLAELLAIQSEGRSCVVVAATEGTSASLHFEKGTLVHAEDGTTGKALGRILVDDGKLTESQFASLLDALSEAGARGSSVRLGDLAVSRGLLSRKELSMSLFSQVRKKVVAALTWEAPEVRVLPAEPSHDAGRERPRFPTSLEPVVLSAFRKVPRATLEARLLGLVGRPLALEGDLESVLALFRPKAEEKELLNRVLADPIGLVLDEARKGEPANGLAFLAVLAATGRLIPTGGPPSQRKKPVPERFPVTRAAARRRLLRTAKLHLFAPIVRQKVTPESPTDGSEVVPQSEVPGSTAAKLRAERAFLSGKAHMAKGREALAKAEIWRAHRLAPMAAEYELYLGWLTLRSDERRAAELESMALRAKRQDPELGFASYVLSHLALLRGDVERAEAEQMRAQRLGVRGARELPASLGFPSPRLEASEPSSAEEARPAIRARRTRGLPFRAKKELSLRSRGSALPAATETTEAAPPASAGTSRGAPEVPPEPPEAREEVRENDDEARVPVLSETAEPVAIASSVPQRNELSETPPPIVPAVEESVFEEAAPFSFLLPKVASESGRFVSTHAVDETPTSVASKLQHAEEAGPAPHAQSELDHALAGARDAAPVAHAPIDVVDTPPSPGVVPVVAAPTSESEPQLPQTSGKDGTRSDEPERTSHVELSADVMPPSRRPLYGALGLVLALGFGVALYLRSPGPTPPKTSTSASAPKPSESASLEALDARVAVQDAASTIDDFTLDSGDIVDTALRDSGSPVDGSTGALDATPPKDARLASAKTGEIVPEGPSGRRVFVDGRAIGETPATVTAPCGTHEVRVGSKGTPQTVDIPCGGRVVVRP